jgi:hypothetical protein
LCAHSGDFCKFCLRHHILRTVLSQISMTTTNEKAHDYKWLRNWTHWQQTLESSGQHKAPLLRSLEVLGWNLGLEIRYPQIFRGFPQSREENTGMLSENRPKPPPFTSLPIHHSQISYNLTIHLVNRWKLVKGSKTKSILTHLQIILLPSIIRGHVSVFYADILPYFSLVRWFRCEGSSYTTQIFVNWSDHEIRLTLLIGSQVI